MLCSGNSTPLCVPPSICRWTIKSRKPSGWRTTRHGRYRHYGLRIQERRLDRPRRRADPEGERDEGQRAAGGGPQAEQRGERGRCG